MDSIIEDIFSRLVNEFGYGISLVLIAAVAVVALVMKYDFRSLKSKLKSAVGGGRIRLDRHITFAKLDYFISHIPREVRTSCPLRKQLYIDIMTERARVFKEEFLKFVRIDLDSYGKEEFQVSVLSMLDDTQQKFLDSCERNGIPKFILERMNERIFSYHEMWCSQIMIFCRSDYLYENNYERMEAILDLLSVSFEFYMSLFEENLASFNGEVRGLVYKGISCRHCPLCVHDAYLKRLRGELKGG